MSPDAGGRDQAVPFRRTTSPPAGFYVGVVLSGPELPLYQEHIKGAIFGMANPTNDIPASSTTTGKQTLTPSPPAVNWRVDLPGECGCGETQAARRAFSSRCSASRSSW